MNVTNAIKEQIQETVRCFFTCILSPTFPWRNTPESPDGKNNIGTSQTSLYIWSVGFRYSGVFAKHATCLLQLCKNLLDLHYGTDEHAVPCHKDGKTFSDLHCLWGVIWSKHIHSSMRYNSPKKHIKKGCYTLRKFIWSLGQNEFRICWTADGVRPALTKLDALYKISHSLQQ